MPSRKTKEKQEAEFSLPLEWYIPDNVPTHRVTNTVVQIQGDEFVISFFEQRGPIIITEQDRKRARNLESAKALCVARISITPERLDSFTKVFRQQYDQHLASKPPDNIHKSPSKAKPSIKNRPPKK
ncbi:MAG: hypothetical protein IH977_13895 [Nitrospinae bacterium]|nr:hypothetical protein [Nitrospinota bacterium]